MQSTHQEETGVRPVGAEPTSRSARAALPASGAEPKASYADVLAGRRSPVMDEGEVFRQDASVAHSSPSTSGLSDLESDASGDVEVRQASGDEDQRTDISSAASGIASDDGIKTKDGLSPLDAAAEAVIVESIPSFPDGNLDVHVADTKKCADWNFHADQSWRGHSVHDVEYEQHGPGKETEFLCRRVLLCAKCSLVHRAPTSKKKDVMRRWIKKGCAVRACGGALSHVKCSSTLTIITFDSGAGIYRHRGTHSHDRPPRNKPLPSALVRQHGALEESHASRTLAWSWGRLW